MKTLSEYFREAGAVLESQRTVTMEANTSKEKTALYSLKRKCEKAGILEKFDFTVALAGKPPFATFVVSDRDKFEELSTKKGRRKS